jgi:hypothetical protein
MEAQFGERQRRLEPVVAAEQHAQLAMAVGGAHDADLAVVELHHQRQAPRVEHRIGELAQPHRQAELPRHMVEQRVQRRATLPGQRDAHALLGGADAVVAGDEEHGVEPARVLRRQLHGSNSIPWTVVLFRP